MKQKQSKPFKPFILIRSSRWQTIAAAKLPTLNKSIYSHHVLTSQDGDPLTISQTAHAQWQPTDPTIILLHGLCGSDQSAYITRITQRLLRATTPFNIVRLNFRNCGHGQPALGLPHSGRSEDLLACLEYAQQQFPDSEKSVIGFSQGGNIALKLAAELGDKHHTYAWQKTISLCPPMDLAACADLMEDSRNRVFRRYFMRSLNQLIQQRHQHFPELGVAPSFALDTGFWEFDEHYTAPQSGFKSAVDYYEKASCIKMLKHINMPCNILVSKDDPFIGYSDSLFQSLAPQTQLHTTKHGGHMGFLGNPLRTGGFRWMDHAILHWLSN